MLSLNFNSIPGPYTALYNSREEEIVNNDELKFSLKPRSNANLQFTNCLGPIRELIRSEDTLESRYSVQIKG